MRNSRRRGPRSYPRNSRRIRLTIHDWIRTCMSFELNVVSNTPLTPLNDIDEVAILFLNHIGYFTKGYDPKTDVTDIRDSVPYKLMVNFFLERMDKAWVVEDLAVDLGTTKATIYRHINKMKGFDILEEMNVEDSSGRSEERRVGK